MEYPAQYKAANRLQDLSWKLADSFWDAINARTSGSAEEFKDAVHRNRTLRQELDEIASALREDAVSQATLSELEKMQGEAKADEVKENVVVPFVGEEMNHKAGYQDKPQPVEAVKDDARAAVEVEGFLKEHRSGMSEDCKSDWVNGWAREGSEFRAKLRKFVSMTESGEALSAVLDEADEIAPRVTKALSS